MIYCKLHHNAGTRIRLKGPHIGVYCKQCDKWLKWITIDEVDKCIKPELDEIIDIQHTQPNTTLAEHSEPSENDDDVPW